MAWAAFSFVEFFVKSRNKEEALLAGQFSHQDDAGPGVCSICTLKRMSIR